jgi:hypothetical protein
MEYAKTLLNYTHMVSGNTVGGEINNDKGNKIRDREDKRLMIRNI